MSKRSKQKCTPANRKLQADTTTEGAPNSARRFGIVSYNEDLGLAADLEPAPRSRLIFSVWLSHGPGFTEKVVYRAGPSKCGRYDVLWIKGDWEEGSALSAAAWLPRKKIAGKTLWKALVTEYWKAMKEADDWEEPDVSEVITQLSAAFTQSDVDEIARQVWPGME